MKNWYLIKTKPRQEKKAIQNLQNQNYETFCPMAQIKNKKVVLFPGYLFIFLDRKNQNWTPIKSTKGVSHFVRFGLAFAKTQNNIIEFIRSNQDLTYEKIIELDKFKSGDKIQITEGVFKNLIGIFQCYKADDRVMLLLKLLGNEQVLSFEKNKVIAI
jgi:transcriptional antiterminator RfaH